MRYKYVCDAAFVAFVVDNRYHLNEQLDKSSGAPMAAADLTWSYATVLKAMYYRAQYYTAAAEARADIAE